MADHFVTAYEALRDSLGPHPARQRVCVVDDGTPLAVYERTGPGEWAVLGYCDQTKAAPPYPQVERRDLQHWLAEQLS